MSQKAKSQKLGGFGRLDKIGAVALAVAVAVNTGLSYWYLARGPFFPLCRYWVFWKKYFLTYWVSKREKTTSTVKEGL